MFEIEKKIRGASNKRAKEINNWKLGEVMNLFSRILPLYTNITYIVDNKMTSARSSFALPKVILAKLDKVREDIPRSRCLLRLIEKNLRPED